MMTWSFVVFDVIAKNALFAVNCAMSRAICKKRKEMEILKLQILWVPDNNYTNFQNT